MASITQKTISLIESILGVRSKKTQLYEERHVMVVNGLPEDTFNIVSFTSEGGFNKCYRIEVLLSSASPDVDLENLLKLPVFGFSEGIRGSFISLRGYISECEQLGNFAGSYQYRAVMVPKLWFLTQTSHNQIFIEKTTLQILEELLLDGGMQRDEYEFRLAGNYDKVWEYVCQYNESHFNFFCRWLEREGLYFFFEATDDADKLIITDTMQSHKPAMQDQPLLFRSNSGLEYDKGSSILNRFSATCQQTPEKVTLKDYNYRHPSVDLTGKAVINKDGKGEVYIYGGHIQTPEESNRLAKNLAEGITCRKMVFSGCSNALFLRPGVLIEVKDHFRKEYNTTYLITEIRHEGHQPTFKEAGLGNEKAELEKSPCYSNSFKAIPANIQFRPEIKTRKPRFHGMINAIIDATGPGLLPELDQQGRYKVQLPFDLSGSKGGKASSWLRMAQPYTGSNHGMHFPLNKGTEVLLTFIDGDPDRPIIAAAVPNPLNPSQLKDTNATKAGFATPGGGSIISENQPGQEQMTMSLGSSYINLKNNPVGNVANANSTIWTHLATVGAMSLAGMFSYNYSMGTVVQNVGYKLKLQGLLGLLQTGIQSAESVLDGNTKNSTVNYVELGLSGLATVLNILAAKYILKLTKGRFENKLTSIPKLGYCIYADNEGATTFMDCPSTAFYKPWSTDPAPDIGIVSSNGSIDLYAAELLCIKCNELTSKSETSMQFSVGADSGSNCYIKSNPGNGLCIASQLQTGAVSKTAIDLISSGVNLSVKGQGQVLIGNPGTNIQADVPSLSMREQKIALSCENETLITTGDRIKQSQIKHTSDSLCITVPGIHGSSSKIIVNKDGINITFTAGSENHTVKMSNLGIEMTSPKYIKANGLLIGKTNLKYKDNTVNLSDVLKVKN